MPVCYPDQAGKPYRPSNGTEGEMFQEGLCHRCARDPDTGGSMCEILLASMLFSIGDPGYPPEWVYDRTGRPTCTAFHDAASGEPPPEPRCGSTLDMFGEEV